MEVKQQDTYIPFAGVVDSEDEHNAVLAALRSGWHGPGFICEQFEREFAKYTGRKHCLMTNSGSSANLLALKSFNLPAGAKVITSGCGFPATLNPILHLGLTPVLVDYDMETMNIDLDQVENKLQEANSSGSSTSKIYAMIVAHTMANPIDMVRLMDMASRYNVLVIGDCCEAAGSRLHNKDIGSYGDVCTFSFYPSHQMNGAGGGGCIVTDIEELAIKMRSMRNWGKRTTEAHFGGAHATRYECDVDGVMYDSQYTYDTIGFNMQPTDIQAAYLIEQLKKLPDFTAKRKANWNYLNKNITVENINTMKVLDGAEPSYFGYAMNLVGDLEGQRDAFSHYLEGRGIKTRPFFAANITRHTPYKHLYQKFPVADYLMSNTLFVGVWPGLDWKHMNYISSEVNRYFKK